MRVRTDHRYLPDEVTERCRRSVSPTANPGQVLPNADGYPDLGLFGIWNEASRDWSHQSNGPLRRTLSGISEAPGSTDGPLGGEVRPRSREK